MNIKEKFLKTEEVLKKYQFLWEKEPIQNYPNPNKKIEKLFSELSTLVLRDLIQIENLESIELQNSTLIQELVNDINKNLIEIQSISEEKEFKTNEIQGLSAKKVHEIQRLIPFMSKLNFKRLVDIGSGKAHLSFLLAKDKDITCHCIDADKELQTSALKGHHDDPILKRIQFQNLFIDEKTELELKNDDLLFGLHACGDLSISLLNQAIAKEIPFLNIPCCFHKQTIQNLSGMQKIVLKPFALNLANRSKVFMDEELYNIRHEFKRYRYALEFIYQNEFEKPLPSLGNAHKTWYKLDFEDYVKKYDNNCFGIKNLTEKFQAIINDVENYILLEVVRNPLGRLLEQYLILDRVIYLQNKGYHVQLSQIFDSKRSPRNIALYATKEL